MEISTELIASPAILLIDEPTSGLDSSIAFDVLQTVRDLVKKSDGKLSVILTIHQPNTKILELFDHLLLMDQGSSFFFGTLPEAVTYFKDLGFECPPAVTPTDYFLQIADSNFGFASSKIDFEKEFLESRNSQALQSSLMQQRANIKGGPTRYRLNDKEAALGTVPFYQQLYTLIYREYALAFRDPTLYYFQLFLLLPFAVIVGAVFYMLPQEVNGNFNTFTGAILWLSLMNGWVHCFKVYHISRTDKRTRHEIANNKYSPLTFWLADTFTTSTLVVIFFCIPPISYFMIGFPSGAYPFLILNYWMVRIILYLQDCLYSYLIFLIVMYFYDRLPLHRRRCSA